MSNEVIDFWIPINRVDSEPRYPTSDLNRADTSSYRRQSLKEETKTKFEASSFIVLLDNRSKFGGSSVESVKRSDDSAQTEDSALSNFNGADCGEPFVPQCLVYDFTPRPGDEALTLKCSKFWKYVSSRPELRKYKKYPSAPVSTEDSDTATTEELNSKENEDQNARRAPASTKAIKWLTEGKARMITQATLATVKRCQNYCDSYGSYPGDRDATESETAITRKSKTPVKLHELGSFNQLHETALSCHINTRPQTRQVKAMCKEMDSFDEAHPRNLDPPVQVRLQRPVLRNLVI